MKKIFNSILDFEVFFKILNYVNSCINPEGCGNTGLNSTDIHFYHGSNDGGSIRDVRYGHFKMIATKKQLLSLKKEAVVVEPFGEATSTDASEYTVVILNVTGWFTENFGIIFQQRGHMNVPIGNTREKIYLNITEMTSVILLFPMNESLSSTGNKVMQTQYFFENLIYTKDGEIYIPYNKWEKVIDDIRD